MATVTRDSVKSTSQSRRPRRVIQAVALSLLSACALLAGCGGHAVTTAIAPFSGQPELAYLAQTPIASEGMLGKRTLTTYMLSPNTENQLEAFSAIAGIANNALQDPQLWDPIQPMYYVQQLSGALRSVYPLLVQVQSFNEAVALHADTLVYVDLHCEPNTDGFGGGRPECKQTTYFFALGRGLRGTLVSVGTASAPVGVALAVSRDKLIDQFASQLKQKAAS